VKTPVRLNAGPDKVSGVVPGQPKVAQDVIRQGRKLAMGLANPGSRPNALEQARPEEGGRGSGITGLAE
jgi:hypothetical protein